MHNVKVYNEWKLNDSILDDPRVHLTILNKCYTIQNLISNYKNKWYEVFVRDVIEALKNWSRKINKESREYITDLYSELNSIEINSSQENNVKSEEIKFLISEHYKKVRLGAEKRACEVKRNFVFQPSKILIEKEQKNAKKNRN